VPLEVLQLPRESGLGDVEAGGGARDAALLGGDEEASQVPELHSASPLRAEKSTGVPAALGAPIVQHDLPVGEQHAVSAPRLHGSAAELLPVEGRVQPVLVEELAVRAVLDDASSVEDEDRVGGQDRGEPVGDGDGRPPCHEPLEGCLKEPFARRVERADGLVEDEDPWVGEQDSRDREALLLAAGEPVAPFPDDGVPAGVEPVDAVADVRGGPPPSAARRPWRPDWRSAGCL
jgi:hypothetical protein